MKIHAYFVYFKEANINIKPLIIIDQAYPLSVYVNSIDIREKHRDWKLGFIGKEAR